MTENNTVSELAYNDLLKVIDKLLVNLQLDLSMPIEASMRQHTITKITNVVYETCKLFTVKELNKIFDNLGTGRYECKKISVQTICAAIRKYKEDQQELNRHVHKKSEYKPITFDPDTALFAKALGWKLKSAKFKNSNIEILKEVFKSLKKDNPTEKEVETEFHRIKDTNSVIAEILKKK